MALARSASGPGGLSINTGAANLFGSGASQPPPASGLFGASTAKPAQSAPSLFGTAATSQPQQTGGLFGAQAQASQPQSAPSLFGTAAAQPQPQQTGGLFGTQQPQQQQPQQQQQPAGGLFGAAASQQPQQQTGGLFGSAAPSQQPAQTGGLFGAAATAQPQQTGGLFAQTQRPAQTGGFFGASIQQQPQQSTGGLFGAPAAQSSGAAPFIQLNQPQQAQQPQQQAGGLFAAARPFGGFSATQPAMGSGASTLAQPSTLPGLTLGQSTQQQATVPGVRIDLSNLRGTTRFNDLQEDLQNQLTMCDVMIQHCMEQGNQVEAFLPAHGASVEAIPTDVRFVTRKYDGTASSLSMDAKGVKALQEMVKVDAGNAKLSFKAVDNLKLPPQFHTSGLWSTRQQESGGPGEGEGNSDLINFFSKTGDEMDEQLRKLEKNLGEIETHMLGVQSNVLEQLQRVANTRPGGQGDANNGVAELAAVLRDFESSIMQVATVVGGAREGVTALQLGSYLGNGRNG